MRKRIDLYIGGSLVDTDEQTYILLNYAFEDFSNPTSVLNTYTQQVTLPGTQRNNALFGELFRTDRVTAFSGAMGSSFDPLHKTEFTIYDEDGSVLQAGYVKLDGVTRKGKVNAYQVTLYGSLGSFLYGLTYDSDGNKRTLASLDYLGTDAPDEELTFTINATAVQDAWDDLGNPTVPMWSVINFAPCYNGIPEGQFSPDKGIFTPGGAGLPSSSGGYDASITGGFALANLPRTFDEWEVKDLRSYLQRPVVSMEKVMYAISQPRNNGGWTVDYANVQSDVTNLWMTLPLIPNLGQYREESGNLSTTLTSFYNDQYWQVANGNFAVVGSLPAGTKQSAHLRFNVSVEVDTALADTKLDTDKKISGGLTSMWYRGVVFVQVAAYENNVFLTKSKIRCYSSLADLSYAPTPWRAARGLGFKNGFGLPGYGVENDFEATMRPMSELGDLEKIATKQYQWANAVAMDLEAQDADEYRVYVRVGTSWTTEAMGLVKTYNDMLSGRFYGNPSGTGCVVDKWKIDDAATPTEISYTISQSLRSGALISKAMLLGGTATPADYLVSLCKMNGWQMICDAALKTLTIMRRNNFFVNETIDLTERIDRSQEINLTPFVFTAKWYDFKHAIYEGAFAAEYKSAQARDYGVQRVNTGYEFDASIVDLLQNAAFRSAVPVLENSPCYYEFISGAYKYPTPFIFSGNSYTMKNAYGETKEFEISALDTAVVGAANPINGYHPGYDYEFSWKLQLHKADGKPTDDGAGVLVWYVAKDNYAYYKISDDTTAMTQLNGGPCWLLDYGDVSGVDVPAFQRYKTVGLWKVTESLDFGLPAQLDLPKAYYGEDTTVYSRKWKAYLTDRYARDTKVMRCKVRLDGLQVGPELLRKFYWYGGSIWVLNKITNHSLTGFATTECEFVQVQDTDNYLNGQL